MSDPAPRQPLIVLVAPAHADVLEGEFARYRRDYDDRRHWDRGHHYGHRKHGRHRHP